MEHHFKKKLFDLYDRDYRSSSAKNIEVEYLKMIRYGVMGELGENYYIFVYRDYYRNSPYYGAVIFLNKRDALEKPVTIYGLEENGKEQIRNVYVKAGLFFLKNNLENTLTLSEKSFELFSLAKTKYGSYVNRETTSPVQLEDFKLNLNEQKIEFEELSSTPIEQKKAPEHLRQSLNLLYKKEIPEPEDIDVPVPALLGLNLKASILDFIEGKVFYFQPLAIQKKGEGQFLRPRKLSEDEVKEYEFVESDPLLLEYANKYIFIDSQEGNSKSKIKILNHLFFSDLVQLFFKLPDERTFYQIDNGKEFLPLRKIVFDQLQVRFAPDLKKEQSFHIWLSVKTMDNQLLEIKDNFDIIPDGPNYYLFARSLTKESYFLTPKNQEHFFRFLRFLSSHREFNLQFFNEILKSLNKISSDHILIHPEPLKKFMLKLFPIPVIKIFHSQQQDQKIDHIELEYDYEGRIKRFLEKHPDKVLYYFDKNEEFEKTCNGILKNDPMLRQEMDFDKNSGKIYYYFVFKDCDYLTWVIERGIEYLKKGFKLYSMAKKRYIGNVYSKIQIDIQTGIQWLDFKPLIFNQLENRFVAVEEIDMEQKMVKDKEGNLHLLQEEEIAKLAELAKYGEEVDGNFRIPSRNYLLISKLYDQKMENIPELKRQLLLKDKLAEFEHIPEYDTSKKFNGVLRNYQKSGFNWLNFLRSYELSGCLADDMGLGKTIQALVLLQTLKDNKQLKTSLIIAPVSAIPNWEQEIRKFTRGLVFHRHLGVKRERDAKLWGQNDIILTSYATMRNDIEMFKDLDFDYIILDESQNIKNIASQTSKAVKILKGKYRLALSGTPIENNCMDLWSLFDFLMPGFLGSHQWFNRQFATPIEIDKNLERQELLKKMVFPFILRRKKAQVESELPEKVEIISTLDMEEEQYQLYIKMASDFKKSIEQDIDLKGLGGSSMKIFEALLRLRQLCIFPSLISEEFQGIPSVKFEHFKNLLDSILAENHKVLVFSQFVQALLVLRNYLDQEQIKYTYIDGSMPVQAREKMIKTFQEDEKIGVFLLSLKAGGVAINLTAADYVIIFDPWWNPAVEAQAIDRSHRIGQTKKVFVYKLVTKNSIEEKILLLQDQKKILTEELISTDAQTFKNLTKEDILNLFSYI